MHLFYKDNGWSKSIAKAIIYLKFSVKIPQPCFFLLFIVVYLKS